MDTLNRGIKSPSGAIDRKDIARQEVHAKLYYEEVRKRVGDVEAITKNSGFTFDEIKKVKEHIFMAVSWQRLTDGNNIHEMDLVLIKHELMEYDLMNVQGLDYLTAHRMAEAAFNYTEYTKELDRKDGIS